jgi:hypothetical protein
MFRTLLMTVLAVVAIGFGVGSTAEAGGGGVIVPGGHVVKPFRGTKSHASVTVINDCGDNLPIYAIWLPSGSGVNVFNLDLGQLLALGARPVLPGSINATTIPMLDPGDGVLWAVDGVGGGFGCLPSTIARWPDSNYFTVTGQSSAPVVNR